MVDGDRAGQHIHARKALVLDGGHGGDVLTEAAAEGMERAMWDSGYDVERVVLRNLSIAACMGCFGCWVGTPGECLVEDAAQSVDAAIIGSDVVVFVTPVTFGGYSSELKKALDRFICLLDPRFQVVDGETRHVKRYPRYPTTITLGTLPAPDPEAEKVFVQLAERNALNVQAPFESLVLVGLDSVEAAAAAVLPLLERLEVAAA